MSKISTTGNLDTSFDLNGYKTYPFDANETSSTGASIHLQGTDLLIVGGTRFSSIKYLALLKVDKNGNLISYFGTNGKKTTILLLSTQAFQMLYRITLLTIIMIFFQAIWFQKMLARLFTFIQMVKSYWLETAIIRILQTGLV